MLNGEVWLCHTSLFNNWTIGKWDWVRTLGWFSRLQALAENSTPGWIMFGDDEEPPQRTLYPIVSDPKNRHKLFKWDGMSWHHLPGPIVFSTENVSVAWAGDKQTIKDLLATRWDPWSWPKIQVVEVDSSIAVKIERTPEKKPFPVFFVSNGECNADYNWRRLKTLVPLAERVQNIKGRREMFLECARRAQGVSHFWIVTGKNYLLDPNVFGFYPDAKKPDHHWVFNARNAANGLEYGHMGIVLYSTHSVLSTPKDYGLDFTMASPYTSIPWTVSEGRFATTPWEAFRTAYRESFKLARAVIERQDPIASRRLDIWIRGNSGPNDTSVQAGALQGTMDALLGYDGRKTVEWKDLHDRFMRSSTFHVTFPDTVMLKRIQELCQVR